MFGRIKTEYKILEVEKQRGLPTLDAELRGSLATLQHNPAFQYLLQRLRLQRALVEHNLKADKHERLEDVYMLQAGIHWIGWLEKEIAFLTATAQPQARVVTDDEDVMEAFAKANQALEVLR